MCCNSCSDPSNLSYLISNKFASCILSTLIIYNYVCIGLVAIFTCYVIYPYSETDGLDALELILLIFAAWIFVIIQLILTWYFLNIHIRINKLENKTEHSSCDRAERSGLNEKGSLIF
jgi:uncharacterized membrane protein